MVECGKHHFMPNQRAIANGYSTLILKIAAGVDKDILTYGYISAAIGIEWGEHHKRLVNTFARKLRKESLISVGV